MHWKPYCLQTCRYQAQLRGKVLQCSNPTCKTTFYRPRTEIQKVHKSYCSQSCAALINNQNRPRVKQLKACANHSCNKIISNALNYCSRKCFNAARTTYGPTELVKKIQGASTELGRTITKRELGHVAYMCIRAFGSWNKALEAAGLPPHRSHSQRMFKRTNTVAIDGHRCDSISEAVVDNWLTKNNISHERNVSYPSTGHKADWGIGRKTFIEYFGLANDSARYDRAIDEKRQLCKKHNIRLIEIYAKDLYPVVKLDDTLRDVLSRAVV